MVSGNAKLVVDLGNSETRVRTIFGKTAKGNPRSRLSVLPNRYSLIPEDLVPRYISEGVYTDEDSAIFKLNGSSYCTGRICDVEFQQSSMRPSAMEKKYLSHITKLTLINALRQGFQDVASFSNCSVDNLDITWDLYLLLPPEDIANGAEKLAGLARSIKKIDFLMPEISEKEINISKVQIFPEGLCAFIGTVFKDKTTVRQGYNDLIVNQESTLICDVGAGTTDFLLVKGSKAVNTSMFTREIGGNNVHRLVQRALRSRGISLPDGIVAVGCEQGYVMSGSRRIDITQEIIQAKQMVSRQLVEAVQEFFESSMIAIRTISNILVVGGGAEGCSAESVKPLSEYITEYIKELSPDIKMMNIPSEMVDGEYVRLSPRRLNIIGASILAG